MAGFALTEWLYYLIAGLYIVTIIGTVAVVISENRNPLRALTWIVVLVFVPVGGLLFYIFLGRDYRKQRMISRRSLKKLFRFSRSHHTSPASLHLAAASREEVNLLYNICGSKLYSGNDITVYTHGADFFEALIDEINRAERFIHLEFYIFQDDMLGHRVREALMCKAREGVEVRLIYDDVGSWSVKADFYREMRRAGIAVSGFLEVRFPQLANKINYRNHRKIVVVDGRVGFIGGMNIADRYRDGVAWGTWRDTQIRIAGPAVAGLQTAFSVDWYFTDKQLLWDDRYFPTVEMQGDVAMQIATSGPIGEWRGLMLAIVKAIAMARQYVYIQTPYFLPTETLLTAMQSAALAGVDVRLMIPERADSRLIQIGNHSYVRQMLKAGVKVYFYKAGFLHAKMVAVDDELCTVGSTNMDFRSFEHNFEANAFIYDAAMTRRLKRIFLADQQQCERITCQAWRKRPLGKRFIESVIRLFSPML
jgi:cardiolipin synthase